MDSETYIKIFRRMINWEWFHDSKMVHLFIYLLIRANYQDGKWKGMDVKRGQLITGRKKIHKDTGISEQAIRTCITKLKSTNELTIKTTNNYSLITLCKYELYQNSNPIINQEIPNEQPTSNQRLTTSKKNKEVKEEEEKRATAGLIFDVEKYLTENEMKYEAILMTTRKSRITADAELRKFHLFKIERNEYPQSPNQLLAGFEKWLMRAKEFSGNTDEPIDPKKDAWKFI